MMGKQATTKITTKELCSYGCQQTAQYVTTTGYCCSDSLNKCPERRRINSERIKEQKRLNPQTGKRGPYSKPSWNKGKTGVSDKRIKRKYSFEEIFSKHSKAAPVQIRKTIRAEKLKEYKCVDCNLEGEWNNKPINLQLDHVDGDRSNNELSNLEYRCPNCHSQTITWCGKNKNTGTVKVTDEEFVVALKDSPNVRRALLRLGLRVGSGNYDRAYKLLAEHNISIGRQVVS
jgi:hypothetical protein